MGVTLDAGLEDRLLAYGESVSHAVKEFELAERLLLAYFVNPEGLTCASGISDYIRCSGWLLDRAASAAADHRRRPGDRGRSLPRIRC